MSRAGRAFHAGAIVPNSKIQTRPRRREPRPRVNSAKTASGTVAGPMPESKSNRVPVGLAGADAHRVLDRADENLAIADLAGLGRGHDGRDHLGDLIGIDRDVDPDLGQHVHHIFGATVDFRVAFLASEAFDLGHRHALRPDAGERVAYLVELEWLDDGSDQLHGSSTALRGRRAERALSC